MWKCEIHEIVNFYGIGKPFTSNSMKNLPDKVNPVTEWDSI